MEAVDVTIQARIIATSALSSTGTPFFGLQEEHAALPYLCFSQIAGTQIDYIAAKYLYTPRYSFSIFHTDKSALGTLQAALHTAFDRVTLTYAGAISAVSCLRVSDLVRAHSRPTKDGELVYQAISDYVVTSDQTF